MAPEDENFRSLRAIKLLSSPGKWTAEDLIAKTFDGHLGIFDSLLPSLFIAYDQIPQDDPLKKDLSESIQLLKNWDRKASINSIATTLAIFWGSNVLSVAGRQSAQSLNTIELTSFAIQAMPGVNKLMALQSIQNGLAQYYTSWKIPWGELVRFQRTSGDIHSKVDDNRESVPVGLGSSLFGCLPSNDSVWA